VHKSSEVKEYLVKAKPQPFTVPLPQVPYPLLGAAILGPAALAPFAALERRYALLEMSPLYVGVPQPLHPRDLYPNQGDPPDSGQAGAEPTH